MDTGAAATEMLAETASGALERLGGCGSGSVVGGALDTSPSGAFDAAAAADAQTGTHTALCPPSVQCARWQTALQ